MLQCEAGQAAALEKGLRAALADQHFSVVEVGHGFTTLSGEGPGAGALLTGRGSRKQSSVPVRGRSSRPVAPQATHDRAPVTNSPQLTLDLNGGDS